MILRCRGLEQTAEAAQAIAGLAGPGDLLLLTGDLGAGKTTFVKSFAAHLGVTAPVTSPTFTLAQRYEGRDLVVNHLDVYRLTQLSEVTELALPELLEGASVTLIEWGDVIASAVRPNYLEIAFRLGESEDDRALELRLVGQSWLSRQRALVDAVEPWRVEKC